MVQPLTNKSRILPGCSKHKQWTSLWLQLYSSFINIQFIECILWNTKKICFACSINGKQQRCGFETWPMPANATSAYSLNSRNPSLLIDQAWLFFFLWEVWHLVDDWSIYKRKNWLNMNLKMLKCWNAMKNYSLERHSLKFIIIDTDRFCISVSHAFKICTCLELVLEFGTRCFAFRECTQGTLTKSVCTNLCVCQTYT